MAERGPGGREVGRVSLRVLPDTSNFLPSLKKYAERVERTVSVRIGTSVDTRNLEADVARISERVERTVPNIKVPATPVSDGFAADLQAQVTKASKAIQANIPLTADGERIRRQVAVQVQKLEAEIRQLDLEVPLDVESAARAKAELRAKVTELQAFADLHAVQIPVKADGAAGSGTILGLSPTTLATLAGVAAVLSGGIIASLPAILAAIAAPIATIALGFEGIKTAAKVAQPAFEAMRQALSNTFAESLAPIFATLAEALPKITPQLTAIATALSGAFGAMVDQLASADGIAAMQGILQGLADVITTLTPQIGPFTQAFLDIAQTGMAAFVEFAPDLNDMLASMTSLFQRLNDSGVLSDAARGFAAIATVVVGAIGVLSAIAVVSAATVGKLVDWGTAAAGVATRVSVAFGNLVGSVIAAISNAVLAIRTLPSRVVAALGDLSGVLFGAGKALIGGLISGILSSLGPVGAAVSAVAQVIKDHFPGSPVATGPLTSWNNGGAGKRLGDMLVSGLDASQSAVKSASANLAGVVATPSIAGASVASQGEGSAAWRDPYLFADILDQSLRRAPFEVSAQEAGVAIARSRNSREQM